MRTDKNLKYKEKHIYNYTAGDRAAKRLSIGETDSNGGFRRLHFSKRASSGDLNVMDLRESKGKLKSCPYCGHHKIFGKNKGFECTRCKMEIEV